MIELLFLFIQISALILAGLMVMGLVGLGWAMTVLTWEHIKGLWRKDK